MTTSNNQTLIAGYSNINSSVGSVFFMKTDTAGNLVWKETYSRQPYSNTSFIRMLQDKDENILVLARTSAGSNDVSLLKYSLDGECLQTEHFDV